MEKITTQVLKNVIDKEERMSIVDARTLRDYIDFRINDIPFIPLELLNHIKPEAIWNKSAPIYVICYAEKRAKEFCHKLDTLGYRTFYLEEGEIETWCRQNFPVVETSKGIQNFGKDFISALSVTNDMKFRSALNFEVSVEHIAAQGHYFRSIVGMAWFFEKMNCNVKFVFKEGFDYFENSMLKVSEESLPEKFIPLQLPMRQFDRYCIHISSEYAYSIILKLSIKQDIQQQADEWIDSNLTSNWIGVHFRGTDLVVRKGEGFMEMNPYIDYLKKVIKKNCAIFVCSDQAQFIDRMHDTFPGRVFSREIRRSYDTCILHGHPDYMGFQQRINALVDILILSKSDLIYKTAGAFSSLTRFFNPSIKIISTISSDSRWRKYCPLNFICPPRPYLLVNQSFLKYYMRRLRVYFRKILTLS